MDNERYAVRKKFMMRYILWGQESLWKTLVLELFYDNDISKLVKVCKRQDSITFSDWILNFGYHGYIDYPDYLEK